MAVAIVLSLLGLQLHAPAPHAWHRPRAPQPFMLPSPLRFRERSQRSLQWWLDKVGQAVHAEGAHLLDDDGDTREAREQALGDTAATPAVLSDEVCLVPGRPVVRVEVAPGNARRIFTGIDIVAEEPEVLEVVWDTLTDYANLAAVVPNLVSNDVLSTTAGGGARLRQVGGATIAPGVVFKATTTLDVAIYKSGLPASMEAPEDPAIAAARQAEQFAELDSRAVRAFSSSLPLTADLFPRAYCISSLPHRDITMQGVPGEGDFRFYQGVWRLQELPGCAPPGSSAMRLTYSVELSPSLWVPVRLLEGRIAAALGENLEAIRAYVLATREARLSTAERQRQEEEEQCELHRWREGQRLAEEVTEEEEAVVPQQPWCEGRGNFDLENELIGD